jgi:dipeptidyl aminopeptidase/acylaminoacyl peptidase
VAVPNYGGSTGYGRAYRERLLGQWGIVDVADSVAVAQWLVDRERVDGERLAIRGGSAGGFTTLAALTQTDVFSAGVSLYGVSDLRMLAAETHKFESRYLDRLVGDDPDAWTQRAPIEHVEDITAPLLILQGEEDAVVPPSQAELMVERLEAARSPYAYVTFPGEQHGFRQSTSIRRAFEVELSFYGQVFDFEPADDVERIEVRHLD